MSRSPANCLQDQTNVTGRVMVVDDHRQARESVADILRHAGHTATCVSSAAEALQLLDRESFDVIVTDLQMPGMSGLDFILELERRRDGAQVLMITAFATVSSAVEAMRHGAFDYIEKPFDVDRLERLITRAIAQGRLLDQQPGLQSSPLENAAMIGSSPAMQTLRARIAQAAPTPETILITGESGTGKELVARTVHGASDRASKPLISLNCPVLSAQLMESELFGHERGAFTGADNQRIGRFELADGGTFLLDEISEIEPALQSKLLRVLQERSFERVGSSQTRRTDVRVLATTNRDLRAEVSAGRFRQDLYYRLAVIPLHVPPLRERSSDIPELIDHFRHRAAARQRREPCELTPQAHELLAGYHFPGNVRELENIVTRASVLYAGKAVAAEEIRAWLIDQDSKQEADRDVPGGLSLHEMERRLIEATLEHYHGHRAKTAEALGIGIRTLSGKLKEYGYAPRCKTFSRAA